MYKNDLPTHIKESLGYKNLIQALENIFGSNIEVVFAEQYMDETEDRFDDFRIVIKYQNKYARLDIGETQTKGTPAHGPGGMFSVCVEDTSKNPSWWMKEDDGRYYEFLFEFVSPEQLKYLKYEGSVGANELAIEKSLQILKKYLDNLEDEE